MLWPDLEQAVLLEASAAGAQGRRDACRRRDQPPASTGLPATSPSTWTARQPADLVSAAYVLDEIAPASLPKLVDRLWQLTADTLLIVEPGTPAGWRRILAVREQLIAAGAHLLAPCPHAAPCPLVAPDWCHFARRVARSRLHRLAKDAEVPWEDEKFIYVAASRQPAPARRQRVLAPPKSGSGKVLLTSFASRTATSDEQLFTKRDGASFKAARRVGLGRDAGTRMSA